VPTHPKRRDSHDILLGHADSRIVERVYGRLDSAAMGPEIWKVFGELSLPAVHLHG
jgi:hypothetical protein